MSLVLWGGGRRAHIQHLTDAVNHWGRDVNVLPPLHAGDVLLACGEGPVKYLRKHKVFHSTKAISTLLHDPAVNATVTNDRVTVEKHEVKGKLVPVYDAIHPVHVVAAPALGLFGRSPEFDYQITWAFELARRLTVSPTILPDMTQEGLEYRHKLKQVIRDLRSYYEIRGEPTAVALDLETDGLDAWNPHAGIVSVQLSINDSSAVVITHHHFCDEFWSDLAMILRSPKVKILGANLQFDMIWLRHKHGIEVPSFAYDTQLADSLLCVWRSHALEHMTKHWVPELGGYDILNLDKANMRKELEADPAKFLNYSGGDTLATMRVAHKQRDAFNRFHPARRSRFYSLLHRANRAFMELQYEGICIDWIRWEKLKAKYSQGSQDEMAKAMATLPLPLQLEYKANQKFTPSELRKILFTPAGFNLKPKQLTVTTKAPAISAAALADYTKHPDAGPFIEAVIQKAKYEKILSTYLLGFEKHLRSDGRFHPSYLQAWTTTGRLSASSPAILTLPKHSAEGKALRECYVPPDDEHVIMQVDFDAGELKVIANIADCTPMKKVFREGMDIHMVTGQSMVGKNTELTGKEIRQRGKAANFGIIYRISELGLQIYAKEQFFVELKLAEAGGYIDKFFSDYPQIPVYHEKQERFVRQYGYVESPLGRRRALPNVNWPDKGAYGQAVRAAINTPVQSTLSDLCQLAMAILHEQYPQLRCFLFFHDALLFYVKKNELELWRDRVVEVMGNLPVEDFGWELDLPLTASAEFGFTMGQDYKLEKIQAMI